MSFSCTERWESGEGSIGENSYDRTSAIIRGAAADLIEDPFSATKYAATQFPAVSRLGNTISSLERIRLAPFAWVYTATYKSSTGTPQTNDALFSFTTGGQTQKITHSRSTIQTYVASGGTQIDYKGGINVTDSGIEGVDVHIRSFDFKTTFYVPTGSMTEDYVRKLYQLTGCTNQDSVTFMVRDIELPFDPGELLFLGAEGSERAGFPDYELALAWSALPNQTGLSVGDITGIEKKGWEYLWVRSEADKSDDGSAIIYKPIQVNIERIYDSQPLTPLIGATSFGAPPPWLTLSGTPATPLTGPNPNFGITTGSGL